MHFVGSLNDMIWKYWVIHNSPPQGCFSHFSMECKRN